MEQESELSFAEGVDYDGPVGVRSGGGRVEDLNGEVIVRWQAQTGLTKKKKRRCQRGNEFRCDRQGGRDQEALKHKEILGA